MVTVYGIQYLHAMMLVSLYTQIDNCIAVTVGQALPRARSTTSKDYQEQGLRGARSTTSEDYTLLHTSNGQCRFHTCSLFLYFILVFEFYRPSLVSKLYHKKTYKLVSVVPSYAFLFLYFNLFFELSVD